MITVETSIEVNRAVLANAVRKHDRKPRRKKVDRTTQRTLGSGGEIRLGSGTTARLLRTNRGRKLVAYARLETAAQVNRSNEINRQLFGP